MKIERKYIVGSIALSFILTGPARAQVNDITLDVSAGVEHSDNISRSSGLGIDGEAKETVYKGGLNFAVDRQSGSYRLDATGNVDRRQYENGVFDDETVGRLVGNLDWILVEDTLTWNLSANHGQQVVDPFEAITPANREDVTIVSTGPSISLPVAARVFVNASINQSEARYEERPLDNSTIGGSVSLDRQIAPTRTVSLNVGGSQTEYDEDGLLPEIDQLDASIGIVAQTARSDWSIDVGWNRYEREGQEGDGLLLDIALRRALTQSASLSIRAGSQYSTNGDVFRLDQQLESLTSSGALIDTGALDIQGFGDVFRNDNISVGYSQSFGRTTVDLSGSWRAEEYETITGLDRENTEVSVSFSRTLSQTMSISAFASFSNREYDSGDRTDDDTSYGLSFRARLGQKLSLSLSANQLKRDSDSPAFGYDEMRADLSISYAVL